MLASSAPVLAVLLVVLLHFVQSQTNDNDALSEYALGDYGWLMNIAFFAVAVGFAALAVLFTLTLGPSRWSARIGIALLSGLRLPGCCSVPATSTPKEPTRRSTASSTGSGLLVGFPASFAAPLVLARAFRHDERWAKFRGPILVLALLVLAAFVLAFMDAFSPVTVRLAEGRLLTWVVLAGWRGRVLP